MRRENWIKWDLDSRAGGKMGAFCAETGALGYGMFVMFTELLYRSDDHKLPLNHSSLKYYAALFRVEVEQVSKVLTRLFDFELFVANDSNINNLITNDNKGITKDNKFWSPRVLLEMEGRKVKKGEISKTRSDAGQKGMSKRWNKTNDLITNDNKGITNDNKHNKSRLDKSIYIYNNSSSENDDLKIKGYVQHEEFQHCWYSPIDFDQWQLKGKVYLNRCFEKLNGWIEQKRGDPVEFQERVKIGKFGLSGAFQSWVFNSVEEEKPRTANLNKQNKSKAEQILEMGAKL